MNTSKQVYYRPKEVSEMLSVSMATVWNYIKDGKLKKINPSSRVALIHIDDINAMLGA